MVALLHSDRSKATMLRSHRTRAAASSSGGAPAPKWSADTARRAARTQEPATMRFTDVWFSRTLRFAIGVEEESGRYYLSIPVANRSVDYEEYYEIDRATYQHFRTDPDAASPFADRCRNREVDDLLFHDPGRDRGTPA
jgi:hypothetical protein